MLLVFDASSSKLPPTKFVEVSWVPGQWSPLNGLSSIEAMSGAEGRVRAATGQPTASRATAVWKLCTL